MTVQEGHAARQLAEGLGWPEGPTVLGDGRVVFVETYRSRLSVWAPDGTVEEFAYTGGGPNATALGADGCVYVTQNGGVVGPWAADDRRPASIQRVTGAGQVEIIATEVDGVMLRAPNDLAFGLDGRLYFTDPGGAFDPVARPDSGRVFALGLDGAGEVVAEVGPVYPNGIAVERDGGVVWVESYEGRIKRRMSSGEVREIAILPTGHAPDGLALAKNGNLYVTTTASGGLDILTPEGALVGFLRVGSVPTNCTFGGSVLYVTDGGYGGTSTSAEHIGSLWAVDVDVVGQPPFLGSI